MGRVSQGITIVMTYFLSVFSMALSFELIKNIILFVLTTILLIIQIRIHLKRLKKENESSGKKN